jgi:hypothetical protein
MQAVPRSVVYKNWALAAGLVGFVGAVYSYTYSAMKTVSPWRCETGTTPLPYHCRGRRCDAPTSRLTHPPALQNELAELSAELDEVRRAQQALQAQHSVGAAAAPTGAAAAKKQ